MTSGVIRMRVSPRRLCRMISWPAAKGIRWENPSTARLRAPASTSSTPWASVTNCAMSCPSQSYGGRVVVRSRDLFPVVALPLGGGGRIRQDLAAFLAGPQIEVRVERLDVGLERDLDVLAPEVDAVQHVPAALAEPGDAVLF